MTLPFTESVTRRRYASGSAGSDGRPIAGTSTDLTILASIQPVQGKQLQRLAEGLRARVTLVAYTETEFRTADPVAQVDADELVYQGEVYVVDRVEHWTQVLPHFEAYLTRKSEAGGAP
jgi:hypothetical protein